MYLDRCQALKYRCHYQMGAKVNWALWLELEPQGFIQKLGSGAPDSQVARCLRAFIFLFNFTQKLGFGAPGSQVQI